MQELNHAPKVKRITKIEKAPSINIDFRKPSKDVIQLTGLNYKDLIARPIQCTERRSLNDKRN